MRSQPHSPPYPVALPAVSCVQLPLYQPIPYEEPVITLQDGLFCTTSQPDYSAYREVSVTECAAAAAAALAGAGAGEGARVG